MSESSIVKQKGAFNKNTSPKDVLLSLAERNRKNWVGGAVEGAPGKSERLSCDLAVQ